MVCSFIAIPSNCIDSILSALKNLHISQSDNSNAELHDNSISARMPNTCLFRQYAMNFDSDVKSEDVLEPFDLTGILTKLDRKYPELDFFQYEEDRKSVV